MLGLHTAGEMNTLGEKGMKPLLLGLLPRLAQHELPPATLVPQLIQMAANSDDRCAVLIIPCIYGTQDWVQAPNA